MTLVNRSGTEEQYTEREQLLREQLNLADEKAQQKGEEAKKAKEKDNQGKEIRQAAMETLRAERDEEHEGNLKIYTPIVNFEATLFMLVTLGKRWYFFHHQITSP